MTQQTFRILASSESPSLFVRRQPRSAAPAVLYIHGATFPSALSVGFERWAPGYLASDPEARTRKPPAVRIPNGPRADNLDAWAGRLSWDPGKLTRPVSIVRGAWDSLCRDGDAAMLLGAAASAPE